MNFTGPKLFEFFVNLIGIINFGFDIYNNKTFQGTNQAI